MVIFHFKIGEYIIGCSGKIYAALSKVEKFCYEEKDRLCNYV